MAVAAELLLTSPCLAKGAGTHSVSLLGGLAFPSASSSIFTFGVGSFFQAMNGLGFGLFYQRYGIDASLSSDAGSASLRTSTWFAGAEAQYVFSGTLDGFSLGMKAGMAKSSKEATSSNTSGTSIAISDSSSQFFVAPKLAYDYPISRFTIGGETSYIYGFGTGAPKALMLQLVAKFWF
jgi:hypothetical protein